MKPLQFFDEVKREAKKITWPTMAETRASTIMVIIMVALASLFLFTSDRVISWLVESILGI